MAWQEATSILIIGAAFVFAFIGLVYRVGEKNFTSQFISGAAIFLSLILLFSGFIYGREITQQDRANTTTILTSNLWTANISDDARDIMTFNSRIPMVSAVLVFVLGIIYLVWGILSGMRDAKEKRKGFDE